MPKKLISVPEKTNEATQELLFENKHNSSTGGYTQAKSNTSTPKVEENKKAEQSSSNDQSKQSN